MNEETGEPKIYAAEAKSSAQTTPQQYDADFLKEQIEKLKKDAIDIREDFNRLEKGINSASTFMMWVTGGVAIFFVGTGIMVALDYFNNNEMRYERFVDTVQEIRQDTYTKSEIGSLLEEFKDCIWFNGLSHCLR